MVSNIRIRIVECEGVQVLFDVLHFDLFWKNEWLLFLFFKIILLQVGLSWIKILSNTICWCWLDLSVWCEIFHFMWTVYYLGSEGGDLVF